MDAVASSLTLGPLAQPTRSAFAEPAHVPQCDGVLRAAQPIDEGLDSAAA